jgi:poly-gamma-glutamate synthesis protein (capsule biosynthesis protein)
MQERVRRALVALAVLALLTAGAIVVRRVLLPCSACVRPASAAAAAPPASGLPLEELFAAEGYLPDGLDPTRLRVLVATGDIIPARSVNAQLTRRGSFRYAFAATLDALRDGDVRFASLEAPLIAGCPVATSGMQFCGDPRFVDALSGAGIEVVSLANNHAGNYGPRGLAETASRLRDAGIEPAGLGEIVYRDVAYARFAFLAYNGVGPRFDRDLIRRQVAEARASADVVVVQLHWGREYVAVPAIAPGIAADHPRDIGRLAVDAGADLVIGNHPHWVQGVELYRGTLITYAHGNFLFDQGWSRETQEGVIGRYVFHDNQLVGVRFLPHRIYDFAQPRPLEGDAAAAVLERMRRASLAMAAAPW